MEDQNISTIKKWISYVQNSNLGVALQYKVTLTSLKSNIRPWMTDMFNPALFSKPSVKQIPARLGENLVYFISNYVILTMLLLVLGILSQPSFLISLVAIGAVWVYLSKKEMKVYGVDVTDFQKNMAILALLVLSTFMLAGNMIIYTLFFSMVLAGAHAVYHDQPQINLKLETDLPPNTLLPL
mmetsp:Transcript_22477/g.22189  ORF Transcript_22477/g.22189 Transcript_22477/m.22189 type:complete len:183 (+) Transcript_22477:166-714(+)|eukprot:CAMPEP_0202943408 /NCGR_PEP_ID=MMETSP1395-20130829/3840_1 /ASSEMBLY_ACC=CAM_ASM_000871 /TAXON_ID=5961 /ORGANISM="Blepharisma japonicum, Strain Stock R1072" /LENGTH=182 /DNA_ID=CAMNT_0049640849 /DNA_START=98 /DNA_END=646 /DNA_ORIENTATION=+